jgi:Uma2 family endonuclease
MSTLNTTKMTALQFLELGEDPPGIRLELVNGEVAASPSPIPDHSHVEKVLSFLLMQHIRAKKLGLLYGDVDTTFGKYDVRRPDLIYFSRDRLHLVGEKSMEGPPDLCVEIIGPSSSIIDRRDKRRQYEKGGVNCYWIVDPEQRTIEAYKLVRSQYRLAGKGKESDIVNFPPFQELDLPLAELWHPLSPHVQRRST